MCEADFLVIMSNIRLNIWLAMSLLYKGTSSRMARLSIKLAGRLMARWDTNAGRKIEKFFSSLWAKKYCMWLTEIN